MQRTETEAIAVRKGKAPLCPSEHLLFAVRGGAGRLRMAGITDEEGTLPCGNASVALLFDNIPLVRIQSSGSPTCESLLAAGYGLPEEGDGIRRIREVFALPYAGLDNAFQRLRPLLDLLGSGLYILSYSDYYPTDGEGRFFWDVPEELTSYQATAEIYDPGCGHTLPCFPCFFYPSQTARKYDPDRAGHYGRMLRAGEALAPVLAYSVGGYMSVLLDGHHRACACALERRQVPCLTISRPGCFWKNAEPHILWPDGSITAVSEIFPHDRKELFEAQGEAERIGMPPDAVCGSGERRPWSGAYTESARFYPTCAEAGMLALYPGVELNREGLRRMVADEDYEHVAAAAGLLLYAARRPGIDRKSLGMAFAGPDNPYELRRSAYEILDQIKDDPEIDEMMVRVLVECERREDPIYRIADGHWG